MSDYHPCEKHEIQITGASNEVIATFRKLCGQWPYFWGGALAKVPNYHDQLIHPFPYILYVDGMLDLLALIVSTHEKEGVKAYWTIRGQDTENLYHAAMIAPEMSADTIAKILGITTAKVVDYYGNIVRVRVKSPEGKEE